MLYPICAYVMTDANKRQQVNNGHYVVIYNPSACRKNNVTINIKSMRSIHYLTEMNGVQTFHFQEH